MAATTLRHEYANSGWLAAALAMVALAVASGYALAVGEVAGLYVALALIGSVAVLIDFRVGAVLLLLMLPMSPSDLFPRTLMQVPGLNPLNLLVAATVGSYVISGRARRAGPAVRQPVIWLYIVPICIAAIIGMPHRHGGEGNRDRGHRADDRRRRGALAKARGVHRGARGIGVDHRADPARLHRAHGRAAGRHGLG